MIGWQQVPIPREAGARMQPGTRAYWRSVPDGQLRLFVSPPFPSAGVGWHMSISHAKLILDPLSGLPLPGRYPTWDEIRDARYEFIPEDVTMAMLLPPKREYVNLHDTTFHLHQIFSAQVQRKPEAPE